MKTRDGWSTAIITGKQLQEALERAHVTQAQLAERVSRSERAVSYWVRNGVPEHREVSVRDVLGPWLSVATSTESALRDFTDAELLLEIARRLRENGPDVYDVRKGGTSVDDAPSDPPADGPPPTSDLRYGTYGKPGRRRSQPQE